MSRIDEVLDSPFNVCKYLDLQTSINKLEQKISCCIDPPDFQKNCLNVKRFLIKYYCLETRNYDAIMRTMLVHSRFHLSIRKCYYYYSLKIATYLIMLMPMNKCKVLDKMIKTMRVIVRDNLTN